MIGAIVIYGFKDPVHSIICTVKDIILRGMDILIVADCGEGTITAPIEMFEQLDGRCLKNGNV